MVEERVESVEKFWEKYKKKLSTKDCVVSDIDGVWLKGIFNVEAWTGKFSNSHLRLIQEIVDKTNLLLFTNRNGFLVFDSGYIKQVKSLKSKNYFVYKNSEEFVKKGNFKNFGLVINAQKPSIWSLLVLEKLIKTYRRIFYIGAQDFFWFYSDQQLVSKAIKEGSKKLKNNLIFINIKK